MRVAKDFRSIARDILRGRWKIAVLVGLIATILGGVQGMGPKLEINIDESNSNASFSFSGQTIFSIGGGAGSDINTLLMGSFLYILIICLIIGIGYFILGSIIAVGYSRFNLMLVDGFEVSFENLFEYFSFWKTIAVSKLIRDVYVILWSLLLVIPGIMASLSYRMTDYILAENPDMSASEAISISKEMMQGNRWRLFCLEFSFVGWHLLCAFTLGIGYLWLTPYRKAAEAVFYREISGTEYSYR